MRSLALSVAAGKEAAKRGVKAFIELSTGMVYKPDSQPSKEGDKLKPWSKIAVFKLQAEEQLSRIEGYVLSVSDDWSASFQFWGYLVSGAVDRLYPYPKPISREKHKEQKLTQHVQIKPCYRAPSPRLRRICISIRWNCSMSRTRLSAPTWRNEMALDQGPPW